MAYSVSQPRDEAGRWSAEANSASKEAKWSEQHDHAAYLHGEAAKLHMAEAEKNTGPNDHFAQAQFHRQQEVAEKDLAGHSEIEGSKVFFHGTQAPDFKAFSGDTYLAPNSQEATPYAVGAILTGRTGGESRILQVRGPAGGVKSIDESVGKVLMRGGDVDKAVSKGVAEAKKYGYAYASFTHPSITGGNDMVVHVPTNPGALKFKKLEPSILRGHRRQLGL